VGVKLCTLAPNKKGLDFSQPLFIDRSKKAAAPLGQPRLDYSVIKKDQQWADRSVDVCHHQLFAIPLPKLPIAICMVKFLTRFLLPVKQFLLPVSQISIPEAQEMLSDVVLRQAVPVVEDSFQVVKGRGIDAD